MKPGRRLQGDALHADVTHISVVGLSKSGVDGDMQRGLARYRGRTRRWLFHDLGHDRAGVPGLLRGDVPCHGVLAHVTDQGLAKTLRELNVPVIDVSGILGDIGFSSVLTDNLAVGRQAAEHLLEAGFQHFGYTSTSQRRFEVDRWVGFRNRLLKAGFEPIWFLSMPNRQLQERDARDRLTFCEGIGRTGWMRAAPKPVGVFASSDAVGVDICNFAWLGGLAVPEQVAVLACDDFSPVCESSNPPLSSVRVAGERIGMEAGRLLDQAIAGDHAITHLTFDPLGVTVRQSSDIVAVDDPHVSTLLQRLREHATERITIEAMTADLPISRRSLQDRFRRCMGRTPREELFRVRVEAAKDRLLHTNAGVYAVALDCGFRDPESMAQHFRRLVGQTPTAFRQQHRIG